MRTLIGICGVILPFLGRASAPGGPSAAGSVTGDVFAKSIYGEPAVLPGVHIVLHEPIAKEAELDAKKHPLSMASPRGLIRSKQMLPACMRQARWRSVAIHLPPVQSN